MPLVRDVNTHEIVDLPQNIIDHPILGASLEPWPRPESEPEPSAFPPEPEQEAE